MLTRSRISACMLAALLATAATAQAGDWPQWRGPDFNGVAASDETALPATFSPTDNVVWTADLPGPSAATPIIVGDRVFVSSFNTETTSVDAICINRENGDILWQKRLGPAQPQRSPGGENHSAESSPASDGERVIFMTGLGEVVAFDFEGEELWRTNVTDTYGSFHIQFGYASSPLLHGGKLYIQAVQRDVPPGRGGQRGRPELRESYLLCLDASTGEELFRHVRTDDAALESQEAYSTPMPREVDGRTEIVILGGDCITGHDSETGEELWRFGGWNPQKITHWRIVPSPVVGAGLVYAFAPKGEPIFAIDTSDNGATEAWRVTERTTDVATPAFYQNHLIVLNGETRGRQKWVTRINPANGDTVWATAVDSIEVLRASPTAGDGKIYIINTEGVAFVLDAEDGQVLHQVSMGGYPARSSIAIAHGQLFIRTGEKLYCIGE